MSIDLKQVVFQSVKYMFPWVESDHLDGAYKIVQGFSVCVQHDLDAVPQGESLDLPGLAKKYGGKYCK